MVRPRAQFLKFRLFRFEFDSVPAAELGEAGWVMAEPLPQLATWRELSGPLVEASVLV